MKCRPLLLLLVLVFTALPAHAQQNETASPPDDNRDAFTAPSLLPPNVYRSASGRPGPGYWQQRADYDIEVTLDPTRHHISGSETITYTNNSPDSLHYLWVQLDQNLFRPGSRGSQLVSPGSRWRGAFDEGGFDISSVALTRQGQRRSPEYLIDDTRMRIALDDPLPPDGATLQLHLDFAFTIPEYGADRMGRLDVADGTVYQIAQWYPRMYVYDDVNGWNPLPYLGQGEYYLEFGTFEVDITVPREHFVVATGTLENEADVLTAEQQRRLDRARQSTETVHIVRPEEVGSPESRPAGGDMMTWRFRAEDVRDFAWAASEAFIWDAASYEDVLTMSAYPREGIGSEENPGWEMSTEYTRHSIEHYSEMWYPYPYPVAINVAGIVRGMEYPQIVFCGVGARGQSLFGVTTHEFGHEWFPMIVASDERRHAWMDEGLNTFMNYYAGLSYYGNAYTGAQLMSGDYAAQQMQRDIAEQPILTFADRIWRPGLGFLAYRKPGKGLLLLREYILGAERFDPAFRAYINRWAYQHPQPADFFRTIEDVAGEDLDWFWQGWFYGTDPFDQGITDVAREGGTTRVRIANNTDLFLPATLEVQYADGTSERRRIPVEAFFTGDRHTVQLRDDVVRVRLDPERALPDIDRSNDAWSREVGITDPAEGQ